MSLVLSQHISALLGHLQATHFFEETLYCTLIVSYFRFYYFLFDVSFVFSCVQLFPVMYNIYSVTTLLFLIILLCNYVLCLVLGYFSSLVSLQLCSPCALRSMY
jgi:hypothetical protein